MDHETAMNDGFTPETVIDTDVRFYFQKQEGATVQGELIARHARPGREDEFFYEVKLTEQCETVVARGFNEDTQESYELEGEEAIAEVGSIVRVDETNGLRDPLMKVLARDGRYEVLIQCDKKIELKKKKNRSFWRMSVYSKPIK